MSKGGFSKARLEHMHDVLASHVQRGSMPGLVSLISRRGETHVEAIGTKAAGAQAPMARDTIFRIASMTKPVTAIAALILVEESVLRLDEPVERFLPELADRKVLKRIDGPIDETVPAVRPITLRDLLTFRFGFGLEAAPPGTFPIVDAFEELLPGGGPPQPALPPAPDEWIRRFGTLPLMHQPGERWMYNTGSDVLGVLVARASGVRFDAFLRERIFEPLGMADTGFSVPPDKRGRFATSYAVDFETGALELYDAPDGQWSATPAFPSGAGGLVSTVDDFLAFARMLQNGGVLGNDRIVSRPSIETMTTDQLTPEQKAASGIVPGFFESHGWGFGVSVVTERVSPSEPIGKYGWDGGLGTTWFNDPSEDLIGILLTQRAWTSPVPPEVCVDFNSSLYAAIDD
jgi:CubicO group peptidase (beta-lactamase class C family)